MYINHSSSTLQKNDFNYIRKLSSHNFVGSGNYVLKLQEELKKYLNKKHCFVVNNGSNALLLALELLKKKSAKKNEIIVSSYCCPAIINSILHAQLKPVLVDLNKHNLNPCLSEMRKKINKKTLGIIVSSLGGVSFNFEPLKKLKLPIIEDICQSVGSKYKNKLSGTNGDYAVMSFGSTKIITGGIGGAILFNSHSDAKILMKMINYENLPSFYLSEGFQKSYNMSLPDISAGLILSQFYKLDKFIRQRRYIADTYDKILNEKNFDIIQEPEGHLFNRYRYFLLSPNNKAIIRKLRSKGIDARDSLAHNISLYLKKKQGEFLKFNIEKIVSIPIYPSLKKNGLDYITDVLKKI